MLRQQLTDRPRHRVVEPPRALRAAHHQDVLARIVHRRTRQRLPLRTHRVPRGHDTGSGQQRRRLGERRRDGARATGEDARRPAWVRVLLQQHDGNPPHQRGGDDGHRHVSRGADDDVGPEAVQDAARLHRGAGDAQRGAGKAQRRAEVDAAHVQRLQAQAAARDQRLLHAAAAADEEHVAARVSAPQRLRDRQRGSQVSPRSPSSDQRAHGAIPLVVVPGPRCCRGCRRRPGW